MGIGPIYAVPKLLARHGLTNRDWDVEATDDQDGDWLPTWHDARAANAVPLGLAENARVLKPVKAGEYLTYDNCAPDQGMIITQIRHRLDKDDARFLPASAAD